MNKRPLDEEISALLDGEASNPEAVRERLRRDPSLARRYEEYKRLSQRLQAMPEPQVHPAFAARVAARAGEARRKRAARRLWLGAAVPAAALALVALGTFLFWPEAPAPTQPLSQGESAVPVADSDAIFLALQERVEEDADINATPFGWGMGPPGGAFHAGPALAALLEDQVWANGVVAAIAGPNEVDRLVDTLNRQEEQELRALLLESFEGGRTT